MTLLMVLHPQPTIYCLLGAGCDFYDSESINNLTFVNKMGNWPLGNIIEDILLIKSEEGGEGYNAGCIALTVFIGGMPHT